MEELILYLQSKITISAFIEIAIIAFFIYHLLNYIAGTQAEQVVKGIAILLVLAPIASWLGFTTLYYILTTMFTWAFIFIVVVFQPELRTALEKLGTNRLIKGITFRTDEARTRSDITEIARAVSVLAKDHIGALIVCEHNTGLNNIIETGIELDAEVSEELLENIFTPNRPLHDGAVIVKLLTNQIRAAGCLLPLSDNRFLGSHLGTRHRAGLGISEQSDAFTIIVSEETGTISYTETGVLNRGVTPAEIEELLIERFITTKDNGENNRFSKIWEKRIGQHEGKKN